MTKHNDQQLALINAPVDSRVVGVAGAGTGKTTTILARTKRVLEEYETGRVLLITFTRAAANDLRLRIGEEVDDDKDVSRVMVGTFHSIIGNIIRDNATSVGLDTNFTIIDEKSTQIMYRNIIESNQDFESRVSNFVLAPNEKKLGAKHFNAVAHLVSVMTNTSHPEEMMTGKFSDETKYKLQKAHFSVYEKNVDMVTDLLYEIFTASVKDGHRTNTVTYDHILFIGYLLIQNNMLEPFSDSLAHTIVDEYQDTNMLQDAFIQHVAGDKLTIVGDVDQSIYEFRGGKPSLITDHAKQAQIFNLSYNYRSFQPILNLANNVIAHNQTGKEIRDGLKSMRDTDNNAHQLVLTASAHDSLESEDIIKRIQHLHDYDGVPYDEMAILIRSRMSLPSISHALARARLPVNDTTKYADFMRSSVVTDILNYFKVFSNPKDVYAFLGIINTPKQGIGPAKIKILQSHAENHKMGVVEFLLSSYTEELTPALRKNVENFVNTYQDIIDLNDDVEFRLTDLFDYILSAFKYENWVDGLKDNAKLKRDLITLRGIIAEFEEEYYEEHEESTLYDIVNAFVFEMTATTREESVEGVVLTTVHNAKGLEWKHVFIIGLEDENFPGTMVKDEDDLEAERRLMYVALTRAQDALYLYVSQNRVTSNKELTPSRFVQELGMPATHILKR